MASLGLNQLEQQKPVDYEPLLRECLLIREKTEADPAAPGDHDSFYTKSLLGGPGAPGLGQKNYAAAESRRAGTPGRLRGDEAREAKTPRANAPGSPFRQRLTEALERLVQLYDAWGQKEKAAEWRKKLEEAKLLAQPGSKKADDEKK